MAKIYGTSENIHLLKRFPKRRNVQFSQIRRASDSIALNISRLHFTIKLEFKKILGYSIRSLAEVVTCLYKSKNRNYISDEIFEKLSRS